MKHKVYSIIAECSECQYGVVYEVGSENYPKLSDAIRGAMAEDLSDCQCHTGQTIENSLED